VERGIASLPDLKVRFELLLLLPHLLSFQGASHCVANWKWTSPICIGLKSSAAPCGSRSSSWSGSSRASALTGGKGSGWPWLPQGWWFLVYYKHIFHSFHLYFPLIFQ